MKNQTAAIPRPALILGLCGLLPFIATAFATVIIDGKEQIQGISNAQALHALGAYGAVILSFLGGIRWGRLLADNADIQQWAPLTLSVIPSVIAWCALLFSTSVMLILLIAGFACQYAMDRVAVNRQELPAWFGRLRLILTSGVLIFLSMALLFD
ncbi:DUF3429 domain-containing protein [Granulosicoccus sp. 3-233]|uniref:DUF3429 domain-containing protein n=1 Tax=Granulosicoccus sp. 3-233 TaxID=3417969 RepID=UPI003D332F98